MTVAEQRVGRLERIAPLCEMRGCTNRADYFWLLLPGASNRMGWIPVCHEDVSEFAELGLDPEVVPVAEQAIEARHHPPLEREP